MSRLTECLERHNEELTAEASHLASELARFTAEVDRLKAAATKENDEVCQILGRVLGYPWFRDDQANFPGATEADGVCVGDHVGASLADEAVKRIERLTAAVAHLSTLNASLREQGRAAEGERDEALAKVDDYKAQSIIKEVHRVDSENHHIKVWDERVRFEEERDEARAQRDAALDCLVMCSRVQRDDGIQHRWVDLFTVCGREFRDEAKARAYALSLIQPTPAPAGGAGGGAGA